MKKVMLIAPTLGKMSRYNKGFTALKEHTIAEIGEPLGIEYIGGYLRENDYDVKLVHQLDMTNEDVLKEVDDFHPDVVGVSSLSVDYKTGAEIAKSIKERYGVPIIFGGYHATGHPEIVEEDFIDYAVQGHGEHTMLSLLESIYEGGNGLGDIPNLVWKSGSETRINRRSVTSQDEFKALPAPLREGIERGNYIKIDSSYPANSEKVFATVISSKGCPHSCSFCMNEAMNLSRVRYRNISDVIDEMESLYDEQGVNYIFFADEEFTLNPRRLEGICEGIISRDLQKYMNWTSFASGSDIRKPEYDDLLELMKHSGCEELQFGVESGDRSIIADMRKSAGLDDTLISFEKVRGANIASSAMLVLGSPRETVESLDNTSRYIRDIEPDRLSIFFEVPFKGTRDYDKKLFITDDTDLFTTDNIIIKNEYLDSHVRSSRHLKEKGIKNWADYLSYRRNDMMTSWYCSGRYTELQEERVSKEPRLLKPVQEWYDALDMTLEGKFNSEKKKKLLIKR